jgi:hypothetical protein
VSCTTIKDIHKKKEITKSDSTVHIISSTTTTETTTGTLNVQGDTLRGDEDANELAEHPIEIEDGDLKLIVREDKKTHVVTATAIQNPKIIPITTVKISNNKTETNAEVNKQHTSSEKDRHVETDWHFSLNYLWWLLLLLLIPVWKYRKQLF